MLAVDIRRRPSVKESFCRGDMPSRESVFALLSEIYRDENCQLGVGEAMEFAHYTQSKSYDIRSSTLSIIYASLELRFGLIRANTPRYTSYKFQPRQGWYATKHSDKSKASQAIHAQAKKAVSWYDIDVNTAGLFVGLMRQDLVHKLEDWNADGTIDLKTGGVLNVYRIMRPFGGSRHELEKLTVKYREAAYFLRPQEVRI